MADGDEAGGVGGVAHRHALGGSMRRFGMSAALMYKWKRSVDQGLKETGALIPRSQVAALQKRIDELERALGRKAYELDVLKKVFELKGLKLPEGISGG